MKSFISYSVVPIFILRGIGYAFIALIVEPLFVRFVQVVVIVNIQIRQLGKKLCALGQMPKVKSKQIQADKLRQFANILRQCGDFRIAQVQRFEIFKFRYAIGNFRYVGTVQI